MMLKLLLFLTLLVPLQNSIYSYEEDQFRTTITSNYQYYQEEFTDDVVVGRIVGFIGAIDNDLSVSLYFKNTHVNVHQLQVSTSTRTYQFTSDERYGVYYQVNVKPGTTVTVSIVEATNKTIFKQYQIAIPNDIDTFKTNALQGDGQNDFPPNSQASTPFSFLRWVIFGLICLSIVFILIILVAYRKKRGVFNPENRVQIPHPYYQTNPQNEYGNYNDDDYKVVDADYEVNNPKEEYEQQIEEPKTKKEQMEELFKAREEGRITEQQLNAALRSLWWEDDDSDNE